MSRREVTPPRESRSPQAAGHHVGDTANVWIVRIGELHQHSDTPIIQTRPPVSDATTRRRTALGRQRADAPMRPPGSLPTKLLFSRNRAVETKKRKSIALKRAVSARFIRRRASPRSSPLASARSIVPCDESGATPTSAPRRPANRSPRHPRGRPSVPGERREPSRIRATAQTHIPLSGGASAPSSPEFIHEPWPRHRPSSRQMLQASHGP